MTQSRQGRRLLAVDGCRDTGDPTYVYNQGRCFEQAARYQDAIRRFQVYLRAAKKLSREEQADARKHIADCQDLMAKEPSQIAGTLTPGSGAQPRPAVVPAPAPAPAQIAVASQQPSLDDSAGSASRITGSIVAGTGGALLVTGVVLNLKANSMSRDLESYYQKSTNSSRETYKTLSQVSYGVGAACVAGGAVLLVLTTGLARSEVPQGPSETAAPTKVRGGF